MNFFEHQDRAHRRSNRLVILFILAVLAIIAGIYLAISLVVNFSQASSHVQTGFAFDWWDPVRLLWVGSATAAVIGLGSLYKIHRLSSGGSSVAQMLGGTPVPANTTDLARRRLLNVVEEMAIASGIPVPDVYILENERGINAFAAGFNTGDAVIGVTRGTLETLNRDELQGVIAHEFSHILNGDMRLNLRLIGILHGILVIGLSGYWLLRIMSYGSRGRSSGRGGGAAILGILMLGLVLLIVGYLGVFFGKLIQAGVCRQREYLADASSVQFTRNPSGIAGALKKIGGLTSGSQVNHRSAPEAGHLFFGSSVRHSFFGLLATHPPLVKRIQAIDPTFTGEFDQSDFSPGSVSREEVMELAPGRPGRARRASSSRGETGTRRRPSGAAASMGLAPASGSDTATPPARTGIPEVQGTTLPADAGKPGAGTAAPPARSDVAEIQATIEPTDAGKPAEREASVDEGGTFTTTSEDVVASIGLPSPEHVAYSQALLQSFPDEVNQAVREPFSAQAVLFCLLLDPRETIRETQLAHLDRNAETEVYQETLRLLPSIVSLGRAARLPLIDLTLPALRQLSLKQYNRLAGNVQVLIEADQQVDLFEYTLQKVLLARLRPAFRKAGKPVVQFYAVEPLAPDLEVLLSTLARVGHLEPEAVEAAFRSAAGKLRLKKRSLSLLAPEQCNLSRVNQALNRIRLSSTKVLERVIEACVHCVAYDGQVTLAEAELLRAIGDALDCPIPPFLPRS